MKNLLFLLSTVFFMGCQNNKQAERTAAEDPFFATTFSDYKEFEALADYEKEIDTSVYMGGLQDFYRLMNLRKNDDYLVLFYKVTEWDKQENYPVAYQVIDTIHVKNVKEDEWVSVGYCYHEDYYEGEVIASVRGRGDSELVEIMEAWRANPESGSVEALEEFEGITCLNETLDLKGKPVSLKHLDLRSRTDL